MPKQIPFYFSTKDATELLDAINGVAESVEIPAPLLRWKNALDHRIPLEGFAPWRKVIKADETVGAFIIYRTEKLECGHELRLQSKQAHNPARRRRCQECQDELRRKAGWSEFDIEQANGD
jgi:hypothetical protein